MADDFAQSAAPHFRQSDTPLTITLHRLIALALLMIFPLFNYGARVLVLALFGVLSAVGAQALWNALARQPQRLDDLTAVEIGLTCTVLMPARAPYPLLIFTAATAILVGKMPFGGTRRTPFVPAAVGYALAAICFPAATFTYSHISENGIDRIYAFRANGWQEAAYSQIAQLRQGIDPYTHMGEYLLGEIVGPLGTTAVVLLVMAGLWLYMSGNLAWQSVAGFCLAAAAVSFAIPYHTPGTAVYIRYDLLGGSTFFCCLFMAGNPHDCPKLSTARCLWGGICGGVAVLIQHFGHTEAGGAFAVLLLTPFASACDRMVWCCRSRGISYRTVTQAIGRRLAYRMKTQQERELDESDETE